MNIYNRVSFEQAARRKWPGSYLGFIGYMGYRTIGTYGGIYAR